MPLPTADLFLRLTAALATLRRLDEATELPDPLYHAIRHTQTLVMLEITRLKNAQPPR